MNQPIQSYADEFKRLLGGFSHKRNIRELFTDWLEIAACTMHNAPYHYGLPRDKAFEKAEARYMEAIQKYERPELDAFAKLLGLTRMALQTSKTDFLGKLYMEMEISQDRSGEFFTPYPLSLVTANMMLGDVKEMIEEKGFITVSDPACGAGGMLIAAAQVIEAAGYNPGEVMFFEATDISKACCDMTYLQTALLGMSGIVRHGNSLSLEEWSNRFTPICREFPDRTRRFLTSLMPEATETVHEPTDDLPESPAATDEATPTQEPPSEPEIAPKPDASDALIDLAKDTEKFEQGRLF